MTTAGWTLFDTAIGRCGIAWSDAGVTGVQFPSPRAAERLARTAPGGGAVAPPAPIRDAIRAVGALLRGEAADLGGIDLDMAGLPEFDRSVYAIARTVPPGNTTTYGEIAVRLGDRLLARDVGRALGQNPFPIIVPCHRVLAAGGRPGGFSAPGGVATKLRILAIEGVHLDRQASLFDLPPEPV